MDSEVPLSTEETKSPHPFNPQPADLNYTSSDNAGAPMMSLECPEADLLHDQMSSQRSVGSPVMSDAESVPTDTNIIENTRHQAAMATESNVEVQMQVRNWDKIAF